MKRSAPALSEMNSVNCYEESEDFDTLDSFAPCAALLLMLSEKKKATTQKQQSESIIQALFTVCCKGLIGHVNNGTIEITKFNPLKHTVFIHLMKSHNNRNLQLHALQTMC